MYLKNKVLLAFAFIVSIFSSTVWSADDFPEEGALYRIENQRSKNYLNSYGFDAGGVGMDKYDDEHPNQQLWYFEKDGEFNGKKFYKIKNMRSENCIYGDELNPQSGNSVCGMVTCSNTGTVGRWYLKKDGEFYNIRNYHHGTCLGDGCDPAVAGRGCHPLKGQECKIGRGQAYMSACAPSVWDGCKLWSFEKNGSLPHIMQEKLDECNNLKNTCITELEVSDKAQNDTLSNHSKRLDDLNASAVNLTMSDKAQNITLSNLETSDEIQNISLGRLEQKLEEQQFYINGLNLFSSSFVSGAAYSLVPEVIKDGMEFKGYPKKAANVTATVIQGAIHWGMIAYNAASSDPLNPYSYASCASTVTGMVARYGSSYFLSNEASAIAGSTAAVITTVLLSPEETAVDCATRCTIALVGSYAGSTLALKAKSWIYGLWNGNGETSKEELVSALSTLQKVLVEKDKALKEKDDEIKRLRSSPLANY